MDYEKMDPQAKQRWLVALRSGEYKQGHGQLRTADNTYCCLGVLANILGKLPDRPAGFIPEEDAKAVGLEWHAQHALAQMNDRTDDPADFNRIADWIEENL